MAAVAPDEAFGLDWPYPLFGYQKEGIEKLLDGRSVLLADEMGLGKTIQAIAAIRILVARKEIARALIVCPVTLIAQWRRQIRIWAPELAVSTAIGRSSRRIAAWRADAALYLSSFESVRADVGLPSKGAGRIWDVVVLDEAQRIKNAKSAVAAAVKSLNRARSWVLTGTPLENRLDDLLSVLDFAAPGEFRPQAMGVGLRALMARVQLRRRRAEVLDDLPPKFASVIGLDRTAAQRAAYRKAEEKGTVWLRSLGRRLRISHVLELILRLKQICNFCPETGDSAKLDDLAPPRCVWGLRGKGACFLTVRRRAVRGASTCPGIACAPAAHRHWRNGQRRPKRRIGFVGARPIAPSAGSLAPRWRDGVELDRSLACHPFPSMVESSSREPSRGSGSSNRSDATG